jgi:hypothetical protein
MVPEFVVEAVQHIAGDGNHGEATADHVLAGAKFCSEQGAGESARQKLAGDQPRRFRPD